TDPARCHDALAVRDGGIVAGQPTSTGGGSATAPGKVTRFMIRTRPQRRGLSAGPPAKSVHGHTVRVGRFTTGLEEGCTTTRALAAAAGGEAERLCAVVERAAGVAGLGTHVGLDQAFHGAAGMTDVMDRDIERGDGSAVGTRRRPGALYRLPDK